MCASTDRPMTLEIDSGLDVRVREKDCGPVVFVPDVDFSSIQEDSIIESF